MTLEKMLTPYYCQQALQLCRQARILRNEQRYQEAAEICSFVSTLCVENENETCGREAKLCGSSAKHLKNGNYSQAEKACKEAMRICPKSYVVRGS